MARLDRRTVIKSAGAAGVVALAGCSDGTTGGSGNGDGQSYEWTMAAAVGEGHAFDIGAREFKSTIEEMSDGRFTINVQVGGAYGGEVEQMETLSTGGVEMLSQSVGVSHAVYAPNVLGLILPLFIDSPVFDRWTELINTAWERTGGKETIAEEGLTITSPIAYAGLRHTTANQAIRTPSDVDGVQIRLPEVPLWPDVFSAFGFQPVALAVDELYSALQQGTVQASEGEIYQVRSQNLNEVQSHYNLTGHFPQCLLFHGEYRYVRFVA